MSALFRKTTGEQKHCRILMFFLLYWRRIDYLTKESQFVAAVLISATSSLIINLHYMLCCKDWKKKVLRLTDGRDYLTPDH